MTKLSEALQLLRYEPEIIRRTGTGRILDGLKECAPLIRTRDDLRTHIGRIRPTPPPLDPNQVWQTFEANGGDLTKLNNLEVRTLCSAGEFAIRQRFVQALQADPERLKNGRCLYALVNSYFTYWREMENAEELERVLRSSIARYPRKSPAVELWRSAGSLFSDKAANGLADFIATRQSKIDTVLALQYVGTGTKLASATRARTAEMASGRFQRLEQEWTESACLTYLDWILDDVLTSGVPLPPFHASASVLIMSRSAEKWQSIQSKLHAFVQRDPRLGDPRLKQYTPNWRGMHPDAGQRVLSWLARESILFFFNTILPPNDENRRRAEFWLRYHRKILDFQVAMSDQDLWKFKANKAPANLPVYSRVAQTATSAFLMQFRGYAQDYVIAEFSETGNAAYIYDKATFESRNVNLRTPQFNLTGHLKHERWPHRILHQRGWERPARRKLAELGIVP